METHAEDRLTGLPEDIITIVLNLIPTKSAVETAFLAKTWKPRWKSLTCLDFDEIQWPESKGKHNGGDVTFTQFVNMVFEHVKGPIEKIRLNWHADRICQTNLTTWLNSAIERGKLQEVFLGAVRRTGTSTPKCDEDAFELPPGLYGSTLRVLDIQGCFLIKTPIPVSLPKLGVLTFDRVKFDNQEAFERIIESSPALSCFTIKKKHYRTGDVKMYKFCSKSLKKIQMELGVNQECYCEFDLELELVFDTPNLETLLLTSPDFMISKVHLNAMPAVTELTVDCGKDTELVNSCRNVCVLRVGSLGLGCLGDTITFRLLKKLTVAKSCSWSILLDFLDRCEVLQHLDLTDALADHPSPLNVVPTCFSTSLKQVAFRGRYLTKQNLSVLRFILEKGNCLETLKVYSDVIVKDIELMSRASPRCNIVFKGFEKSL